MARLQPINSAYNSHGRTARQTVYRKQPELLSSTQVNRPARLTAALMDCLLLPFLSLEFSAATQNLNINNGRFVVQADAKLANIPLAS